MKTILLATILFLTMLAGLAVAECDRCSDSRNACTGDSESEILSKCGSPTRSVDHVNAFGVVVATTHYYDLGPGKFIRAFTFRSGKLIQIGTGGR
jgi:hypothetical protein